MAILRCPCDTGLPYAECCAPLHGGTAAASTAEQLMRSRYSAFALGDAGYLLDTWHASTRPRTLQIDPGLRWIGLDVLGTTGGSPLHSDGTVEFRAHYLRNHEPGAQHENSRFLRDRGQWRYLDGVALT